MTTMVYHRSQPKHEAAAGVLRLGAILILGLSLASFGATEARSQAKPAQPSAAPAASKAQKPAPPAASSTSQKPKTASARKAPAHARATTSKAKPQAKAKAAPKAPTAAKAELEVAGRRDPFKLPPPPSATGAGEITGPLPPGIRGLVISQLQLEGIVRMDTTNQMIAVVTNYTKRAYFLRENDTLYNGVLTKIEPDAVHFKENHLDPHGNVTTVEVVKRLSPAPGEGR